MPRCPICQSEVGADYGFCPNCGARLVPARGGDVVPPIEGVTTIIGPPPEPQGRETRRSGLRAAAAVVIVALLAGAVFAFFVLPSVSPVHSSSSPIVIPTSCPSTPASSSVVAAPTPEYDLQEVMLFTQTYPQLEVNVTAVAQCDANGFGPAYLLNGLSNTGDWYQVGINWNWPLQTGGYVPGFGFVSEAWAPGGLTRSPPSVAFSGTVNQGDTIELSLSLSGGQAVASARDLKTGASGSMSYPARGATSFIGSEAQQSHSRFSFATEGYFTGLMTEWYHVSASGNGPGQDVTYSENATAIASASIAVGEWNFTTTGTPSSVFSVVADNGNAIDLGAHPTQLQQFTLNGYVLSADAYEFVT